MLDKIVFMFFFYLREEKNNSPDAGVDVGIIGQESLLGGMVKVRAVVDAGNFRG